MSPGAMHPDEIDIDATLVRRLLSAQFSRWSNLPLAPVHSAGTDNALFRLGDEMVVRLPRGQRAAGQVGKEQRWLPRLAPLLPLAVPVPLATGSPGEGYSWNWSIYRWIEGQPATTEVLTDPSSAAAQLGEFVARLGAIESDGAPEPGPHNFFRGVPLGVRDAATREAVALVGDEFDTDVLTEAWDAAIAAPRWLGPATWLHGDLHSANLLARGGRLVAVIDFGGLAAGDPACDMMAAWTWCTAASRGAFRAAARVDDATWARGRGWALSFGVIALPYYRTTNPTLADMARRAIQEVADDR